MNFEPRYASGDVRSPRNSECASAKLADLDWSEWWSDFGLGGTYLHVLRRSDDTMHRVHCRHAKDSAARLCMNGGLLCWLWEKKTPVPKPA